MCWRAQPTAGNAILGQVVLGYIRNQVEPAMRSKPASRLLPGLCFSSRPQVPVLSSALTSLQDGL